ncbi:MAG: pectinesterase family protein [candidate division WOR-3 bacterium]
MPRAARLRFAVVLFTLAAALRCPKIEVLPTVLPRADIVVAADGTGTCQTIREALSQAEPGNTILVRPGIYQEQVKFEKVGHITLLGLDPMTTVIDASYRYAGVEVLSDSNRISGLTVRNADSHGIWVRDGHQTITGCLIVDNGERGIYLSAMAGNASARISHCTIADNGETGIYAARDSAGVVITDCIIAFNPRGIATDQNTGRMTVQRNCLFNQSCNFDRVTPGDSNIMQDPKFLNRELGDYRLSKNSPCRKAGREGTNIGCF